MPAQLGGQRLPAVLLQVEDGDGGAPGGQCAGGGLTEPGGSSGDHGCDVEALHAAEAIGTVGLPEAPFSRSVPSPAMRGIILAGGTGTRLFPITHAVSKQLMPVYDKPMIYYPLSTLMMAGIREVLIITTPGDQEAFRAAARRRQPARACASSTRCSRSPEGLAQAFLIGADFIGGEPVALVLGDNIFYGAGPRHRAVAGCPTPDGGHVFAYHVANPQDYGVVEFDDDGRVLSIEEKPAGPKSTYAVPGLYFYDSDVVEIAPGIKPQRPRRAGDHRRQRALPARGPADGRPCSTAAPPGSTPARSPRCARPREFVSVVEERQGLKIGCIEEVAWRNGWLDDDGLRARRRAAGQERLRRLPARPARGPLTDAPAQAGGPWSADPAAHALEQGGRQ